jgi:hypothetical protein
MDVSEESFAIVLTVVGWDSRFLQNADNELPDYTVSQPRKGDLYVSHPEIFKISFLIIFENRSDNEWERDF